MIEWNAEWVGGFSIADGMALGWFLVCWVGYTIYSSRVSRRRDCLASVMDEHRVAWIAVLLQRENRVADASLIANLERNVAFFASSSLLVLAGLAAALGAGEDMFSVVDRLSFNGGVNQNAWEGKLLIFSAVFMYSFFKFSWSLRQYGFASVLIGRAPEQGVLNNEQAAQFAEHAAKVISRAAHAFNLGLRSYYFSLAYLVWFVNPWAFMVASTWVVGVLYRREFHSKVLGALDSLT